MLNKGKLQCSVTPNFVVGDILPKNVEFIKQKHHCFAVPLTFEYTSSYNGDNMISIDGNSHQRHFAIDMKRIFESLMFKDAGSNLLHEEFAKFNLLAKDLKAFMGCCVLYSFVVYESLSSFPISVEWMFERTDAPFVVPFEASSRSSVSAEEATRAEWRKVEGSSDLLLVHGVCPAFGLDTVQVLRFSQELLKMLHPKESHQSRVKWFESSASKNRCMIEYLYVDANYHCRTFLEALVQRYLEETLLGGAAINNSSSNGGNGNKSCSSSSSSLSTATNSSAQNRCDILLNKKGPLVKNDEALINHVMKHSKDGETWRVEVPTARKAFEHSFMTIEHLSGFVEGYVGIPEKMSVQLRGFDSRPSLNSSSLSCFETIERRNALKVVLFVVTPIKQ